MTASQTNPGDLFEITDGQTPTGRKYTRLPDDHTNPHPGYVRAKPADDKPPVDIANSTTIKIIRKA